ncbi:hypothetical protein SAMN02746064_00478 [Alkalibacter saccharofermentans DSM 14828]|uniref:Uncharacterized protein n=2 Tax=Alkalibacter TaxID=274470 RepID=A0A1M4TFR4_9FIRM|nr:hypothetical protein SAMN02746064_00478 [Alkalibacter saccharofermentans DSM 14828]
MSEYTDPEELAGCLEVLLSTGYINKDNPLVLSFEVKPFGDEDPDIVIANAKRTLNDAWIKVK